MFRSIDTESCVGFPTTNAEAYDRGLISSAHVSFTASALCISFALYMRIVQYPLMPCYAVPNGKIVDKSIQHAYIHAIRKVQPHSRDNVQPSLLSYLFICMSTLCQAH